MRLMSDQFARLAITFPNAGSNRSTGFTRMAVESAYRDIASRHPWAYLRRRTQVKTVASYNTGTIAYTASTYTLTLSSGTWPDWAKYGSVIISGSVYKVVSRTSDTVVILSSNRSPSANVTAGTSYTIYRAEYPLPADFVRANSLSEIGRAWNTLYVPPEEIFDLATILYAPTRPWRYTITGTSQNAKGTQDIVFIPPPGTEQIFDVAYEAKPRPRTLSKEATSGTISISGTTVTGVGTLFTSAMEGCVLRVGDSGAIPTDASGASPSSEEYVIKTYVSSTELTLSDTATTASAVKYLIDDIVDIDPGEMMSLFDAMCKYAIARETMMDNRAELKIEMMEAQKLAMSADAKTNLLNNQNMSSNLYGMVAAREFALRST